VGTSDSRELARSVDKDQVEPKIVQHLRAADSPATIRWDLPSNRAPDELEFNYYFLAYPESDPKNDPLAEIQDLPAGLWKRARRFMEPSANQGEPPSDIEASLPLSYERWLRLKVPAVNGVTGYGAFLLVDSAQPIHYLSS